MPINATSPASSREAGYDLAFGAATLYVKPALSNGAGVSNQAVAVADLALVDSELRNDLTAYQTATDAALEALRRGVPKSYAVAGVATTIAGIAAAAVPTYEAPVPEFADYILVTDPLEGGIYTRAGAIVHRAVADFPAGAQIYVDQTNRVYRVQDQPEADADGLTIGEINLVPFSDFNPQVGVDAIITTGSEVGLVTGSEFSQTGRTLRFSDDTNNLLDNLRTDIDSESAINTTQNTRIGDTESAITSHTQSISGLQGAVDDINSEQIPQLQGSIDDINSTQIPQLRGAVDDINSTQIPNLRGSVESVATQVGALNTVTTQQAGQIAAVTAAEAALQAEVDALTATVATKDTAALRDSAIAASVELIKALNPVFALKAGDSQITRTFDSGKNETTFVISGLPLLCKVDAVTDAAQRSIPVADTYLSQDGTSASFVITGNVPFNDNWRVFLASYKPVNFT